MSFFRNDAINRVNLQSGIQALAQGAGQLFLLVFLLRVGISVPLALLAQAAIVAVRFVVRPLVLPLAIRFGLKPLMIAGAVGMAAQYPILAEVHGLGLTLAAFCIVGALAEVLFYVSRNAYAAIAGDVEHRGQQVALGQALEAAASVVAPLFGAWGLVVLGARWTFALVAVVQVASALTLLRLPNIAVAREAPGAWKAARPAVLIIALDGWFDAGFLFIWQIALFLALGQSYAAYGGVMALAALAGAVVGLLIGRGIDAGHGRNAVALAYGLTAAVTLLRAASLGSPWLAAIANAAGGLTMPLLASPLVTVTHNLAKASPCPLRNKMASEGGWDVGCFAACVLAAALAKSGAASWIQVLLALPAIAASGAVLWRYFPRRPS
jgi:DHA1 family inner membrane transport protein